VTPSRLNVSSACRTRLTPWCAHVVRVAGDWLRRRASGTPHRRSTSSASRLRRSAWRWPSRSGAGAGAAEMERRCSSRALRPAEIAVLWSPIPKPATPTASSGTTTLRIVRTCEGPAAIVVDEVAAGWRDRGRAGGGERARARKRAGFVSYRSSRCGRTTGTCASAPTNGLSRDTPRSRRCSRAVAGSECCRDASRLCSSCKSLQQCHPAARPLRRRSCRKGLRMDLGEREVAPPALVAWRAASGRRSVASRYCCARARASSISGGHTMLSSRRADARPRRVQGSTCSTRGTTRRRRRPRLRAARGRSAPSPGGSRA
jgi:hypothetical protein